MTEEDHVILALDVGSSSVRCTTYKFMKNVDGDSSDENLRSPTVLPMKGYPSSSRSLRSVQPNTGKINLEEDTATAEQPGPHSLLDEIDLCIDDQLQHLEASNAQFRILGLGITSFVMNLVGTNRDGIVVGPDATCSYACNVPEVAHECKQLRTLLGPERIHQLHQRTGAPLHSAFALAQLRSLYNSETTQTNIIYRWQTIASICLSRWMGLKSLPISFSEASWTGLFNFSTCSWDEEALSLLPSACREALPEVCDFGDAAVLSGGIPQFVSTKWNSDDGKSMKNPYWERWPALRGIDASERASRCETYCRLFLGLGDGACANIGSQCCTPNRIAVTIGTSAAARVVLPLRRQTTISVVEPTTLPSNIFKVPQGLFCYRIDQHHVLVGGALTDGGSLVEWCRSLLNLTDEAFGECMAVVEEQLEKDYSMSANPHQGSPGTLTMVPFLSGERSTGWRDGATGALLGITRETKPAHLLRSSLESVVLRVNAIVQRLCEATTAWNSGTAPNNFEATTPTSSFSSSSTRIVASGTALDNNPAWRQMLADCSELKVCHLSEIQEATSYGAARMVAIKMSTRDCHDSKNGTPDTNPPACLLNEEELPAATTVADPRESSRIYWKRVTETQEKFIDALDLLW